MHMTRACLVWGQWEEFGMEPSEATVLFSKTLSVGVDVRK